MTNEDLKELKSQLQSFILHLCDIDCFYGVSDTCEVVKLINELLDDKED